MKAPLSCGIILCMAALFLAACTVTAPQRPVVAVDEGGTVGDVSAPTIYQHDLSETQRRAAHDERMTWLALVIGGLCIGLALPWFSPWWVNLIVGILGVAAISVPFLRAG